MKRTSNFISASGNDDDTTSSAPADRATTSRANGGGGASASGGNVKKARTADISFTHLSDSNKRAAAGDSAAAAAIDLFLKSSKWIWNYFAKNAQSHDCYQRKIELKNALQQMFRDVFPHLGVYIVGSSANGFGNNHSDVDICLMVSHEELNQKTEAPYLLRLIANALRKADFIQGLRVITAKVPIIKFRDNHNNIECDINLNNHIGIRNTHLLKCYSDLDWRCRPLILAIKHWAKANDINDAACQTISSYSLSLMAIFFMQSGCRPAVLPVLHKLMPDKFTLKTDVRTLRLNEDLAPWTSSNTQSLGELFGGFLHFYANFKYHLHVVSVRTGVLQQKNFLPSHVLEGQYSEWKWLCIEEPFDLSNAARSVFDKGVFDEIVNVFKRSAFKYSQTKLVENLLEDAFCSTSGRRRTNNSNYDNFGR